MTRAHMLLPCLDVMWVPCHSLTWAYQWVLHGQQFMICCLWWIVLRDDYLHPLVSWTKEDISNYYSLSLVPCRYISCAPFRYHRVSWSRLSGLCGNACGEGTRIRPGNLWRLGTWYVVQNLLVVWELWTWAFKTMDCSSNIFLSSSIRWMYHGYLPFGTHIMPQCHPNTLRVAVLSGGEMFSSCMISIVSWQFH